MSTCKQTRPGRFSMISQHTMSYVCDFCWFCSDFYVVQQDFARWITGEEPESVYATASSFMGVDDTAVVVLKFPSGALCVIDNSRQTSYGYDVRAEVLGVNGMATLRNPLENQVLLSTAAGHTASSVSC